MANNEESPTNDPRPLGGPKRDRPAVPVYDSPTNDPRPLGGSHVPENSDEEKKERNEPQIGEEGGPKSLPDEERGFVGTARDAAAEALRAAREGPLVQIKHKAEHAVNAARAAVERRMRPEHERLDFSNGGEAMPSGAQVELPREEKSTANATQQADNEFPETLQEAVQTASASDNPKASAGTFRPSEDQAKQGHESASSPDAAECGTDMNEPEPFGVTSGARSKL